MVLNILTLGDVVGPASVARIKECLWGVRRDNDIHFVVCNCENAADGGGIDIKSADTLLRSGADVLTTGNHTFKRREIREYLDSNVNIVRPANYPPEVNGRGATCVTAHGYRILVMNVLGLIYMEPLACPFKAVDRMLVSSGEYDVSVLDIHAESTSEKIAMSHYFDGRVNIMFGTHTHVQTADERIMPEGSGYITDLGMCGPEDSVLGIKKEKIIEKLITHFPVKFDVSDNKTVLHGAVFSFDTELRATVSVRRFVY